MHSEPARVRLEIPNDTRYVRIVRLVARGLGSIAGFDMESVEDLRIAVEELCASLFELGSTDIELVFFVHGDWIEARGQTVVRPRATVDRDRFAMSRQILGVACDEYDLLVDGRTATFSLRKLS